MAARKIKYSVECVTALIFTFETFFSNVIVYVRGKSFAL